MSVISMKQLLEAGVHFGHQTRRWNPKMAPYIYTERNGIYIIDLQKSVGKVDEAYNAVADIVAEGGTILFVGTKKQAQDAIQAEAERCGMYYVNERWLGGNKPGGMGRKISPLPISVSAAGGYGPNAPFPSGKGAGAKRFCAGGF